MHRDPYDAQRLQRVEPRDVHASVTLIEQTNYT
jgi:hypothetical protein